MYDCGVDQDGIPKHFFPHPSPTSWGSDVWKRLSTVKEINDCNFQLPLTSVTKSETIISMLGSFNLETIPRGRAELFTTTVHDVSISPPTYQFSCGTLNSKFPKINKTRKFSLEQKFFSFRISEEGWKRSSFSANVRGVSDLGVKTFCNPFLSNILACFLYQQEILSITSSNKLELCAQTFTVSGGCAFENLF